MLINPNCYHLLMQNSHVLSVKTAKPFQVFFGTAIETVCKTNVMKTISKIALLVTVLSVSSNAQVKNYNLSGGPKPGVYVPRTQTDSPASQQGSSNGQASSGDNQWGIANGGWAPGYGSYGNVTLGFGNNYGTPYYGNPYLYNGYYGNNYSVKKASKYAIKGAGYMLGEAIGFNTWHDIYSPILAKAIRHYNYSRQLYWWGNYHVALNHAERARYLAWYSLKCFQNPNYYYGGYNGNGYNQPNPYSDPYNPYYKSRNAAPDGNEGGDDSGFKKQELQKNESADNSLPKAEQDDKELIRSFDKSTLKDE